MTIGELKRGDLWLVDLGTEAFGSEQGGVRPCVIIQNDVGNHYSPTTIVAVVTSAIKNRLPTHFAIGKRQGLHKTSLVLCEQLRVVDKARLKSYMGCLDDDKMKQLNRCLEISIGLDSYYILK